MYISLVLEDTNIALNKTATQSSENAGGLAGFAFNGIKSQDWFESKCSHTKDDVNSWLQVDLTKRALIIKIVIYNRADCCSERFRNANINVADSSDMLKNEQLCVHIVSITTPNNIQTFACKDDVIGRFLRITNGIKKTSLHLCEVEVIGTFIFS